MSYIASSDIQDRLSRSVMFAMYDEDNDGVVDASAVAQLIADACSKVDGYLRGVYTLPLPTVPNEVKRLALDVAAALACQRHPEVAREDWKKTMDHVEAELERLRKGETRLDIQGTPEPAANEGGSVLSGDPANPTPPAKTFANGLGDF